MLRCCVGDLAHLAGLRSDRGYTMVEVVSASAVLAVVSLAVVSALGFSATSSAATSMRTAAADFANSVIENARNLPYDDVGTFDPATGRYGDPPGPIPTVETTAGFTVRTSVTWARGQAPSTRAEYKSISVSVSWTSPVPGTVTMSSSVFGEGDPQQTGDVQVTVVSYDAPSPPVVGAMVVLTPQTGLARTLYTGADGVAYFGNVPRGTPPYQAPFQVSVDGQVIDPTEPHVATVPDGVVAYVVRVQRPSTAHVIVRDASGAPMPGASVSLLGGPVQVPDAVCDGSGVALFQGLVIGTYTASLTGQPNAGSAQVVVGPPTGQDHTANLTVRDIATVSVKAVDSRGNPVTGIAVTLTSGSNVATTGVTGSGGTTPLFGNLDAGAYSVLATATNYVGWRSSQPVSLVTGANPTIVATVEKFGQLSISYQNAYGSAAAGTVSVYLADNKTKYCDVSVAKGVPAIVMLPPGTTYYVRRSDSYSTTSNLANPIAVTDGGTYQTTVRATR